MDAKEILVQLKEKFNQILGQQVAPAPTPTPQPVAASGTEVPLADGTMVIISALEAGGTVSVKDEAGAESPAAAGDYQLQDGTVIKVSEGGVISEVVPAQAPAPAPELSMQEMVAQAVVDAMAEFEAKTQAKLAEQQKQFAEMQTQTFNLLDILVKEPTAKPDPTVHKTPIQEITLEQRATSLFSKKVK